MDRLEAAVRSLGAGLAGLAGSLERELGAVSAERVAEAAPLSPRLEKLIAGRIAVPVREVGSPTLGSISRVRGRRTRSERSSPPWWTASAAGIS